MSYEDSRAFDHIPYNQTEDYGEVMPQSIDGYDLDIFEDYDTLQCDSTEFGEYMLLTGA
jgi:hypothetical protein